MKGNFTKVLIVRGVVILFFLWVWWRFENIKNSVATSHDPHASFEEMRHVMYIVLVALGAYLVWKTYTIFRLGSAVVVNRIPGAELQVARLPRWSTYILSAIAFVCAVIAIKFFMPETYNQVEDAVINLL